MTSIAAALQKARQSIEPGEARLLLRYVLDCSATYLEAHRDDMLDPIVETIFFDLVARREHGEPIAYLTGTREFYGRMFSVAPGVLIPRPETELIVDLVLEKFPRDSAPRILDLGTGSGCLAITLALELPESAVTAVDVSATALTIARHNAGQLDAQVRWLESDWFSSLTGERFDLIVSNPPYIAADDNHLVQGDLRFEPAVALASGTDGLVAIREITSHAQDYLNPAGRLLFEHGYDQGDRARALLEVQGFIAIEQHRDLAGITRVSAGQCQLEKFDAT